MNKLPLATRFEFPQQGGRTEKRYSKYGLTLTAKLERSLVLTTKLKREGIPKMGNLVVKNRQLWRRLASPKGIAIDITMKTQLVHALKKYHIEF